MNLRHWIYLLVHVIVFCIGLLLAKSSDVIWQGVATSMIAAGVAGWVIFLYLFVSDSAAQRQAIIEKAGLVSVFAHRSVGIRTQYTDRLAGARSQIDIIGFGLRSLREDLGQHFAEWAARAPVRVLLIDPQSVYAGQRDVEENNNVGTIRSEVELFVKHIGLTVGQLPGFQVRFFTTIPAINYFRIDDELFWGPYLIAKPSRNLPTFLVRRSGLLWEPLTDHFEKLWTTPAFSIPAFGHTPISSLIQP